MPPRPRRRPTDGSVEFRDAATADFVAALKERARDLEREFIRWAGALDAEGGAFKVSPRNLARVASAHEQIRKLLAEAGYDGAVHELLARHADMAEVVRDEYARLAPGAKDVAFASVDAAAFRAIQGANFDQFMQLGDEVAQSLRRGLQQAVTTGASFESWSKQVADAMMAVSPDSPAKIYAVAYTLARTSTTQLHRTMHRALDEKLGVEKWTYEGPEDEVTREFCQKIVDETQEGKQWTEEEINALDNSRENGGAGAGPGSAFLQGGGWNCRHIWVPVLPDEATVAASVEAANEAEGVEPEAERAPEAPVEAPVEAEPAPVAPVAPALPVRPVDSPAFRAWVAGSKVVEPDGTPRVVYHGTLGDFRTFSEDRSSPESDLGAGIYFTSSFEDASVNYGSEEGPDIAQRLAIAAENIVQELVDAGEEGLIAKWNADDPEVVARVMALARERLGVEHGGAVVPVYLKIENPVVLGGEGETFLDFTEPVDEEGEFTGEEPTGKLAEFFVTVREVAGEYHDGSVDEAITAVMERFGGDGITARELIDIFKNTEQFGYFTDDEGRLVSGEILRETFERLGYDGIIDYTVNQKFGEEREVGVPMAGVDADTVHYIVFDPEQVASALTTGDRPEALPRAPDVATPGAAPALTAPSVMAERRATEAGREVYYLTDAEGREARFEAADYAHLPRDAAARAAAVAARVEGTVEVENAARESLRRAVSGASGGLLAHAEPEPFHAAIGSAKAAHKFGASVYQYPLADYEGMETFLSADGRVGFAIKPDGDIVSAFRHPDSDAADAVGRIMDAAIAAGGVKLDAFDTVLPELYSAHGFRAVARIKWDDSQAPEGWDKALFAKFNGGEPDVVFMVYDPGEVEAYKPGDGTLVATYEEAVALQKREVERIARERVEPEPPPVVAEAEPVAAPPTASLTAPLKEWAAGTAVVNAAGSPEIQYHATNAAFAEFRPYTHFGSVKAAADRLESVKSFKEDVVGTDAGQWTVHPVYLKIESPLDMPDLADIDSQTGLPMDEAWERFYERVDVSEAQYAAMSEEERAALDPGGDLTPHAAGWEGEGSVSEWLYRNDIITQDEFWEVQYSNEKAFALLESKGYDGIRYGNVVEDPGSTSWIIFRGDQARALDSGAPKVAPAPEATPTEVPTPPPIAEPTPLTAEGALAKLELLAMAPPPVPANTEAANTSLLLMRSKVTSGGILSEYEINQLAKLLGYPDGFGLTLAEAENFLKADPALLWKAAGLGEPGQGTLDILAAAEPKPPLEGEALAAAISEEEATVAALAAAKEPLTGEALLVEMAAKATPAHSDSTEAALIAARAHMIANGPAGMDNEWREYVRVTLGLDSLTNEQAYAMLTGDIDLLWKAAGLNAPGVTVSEKIANVVTKKLDVIATDKAIAEAQADIAKKEAAFEAIKEPLDPQAIATEELKALAKPVAMEGPQADQVESRLIDLRARALAGKAITDLDASWMAANLGLQNLTASKATQMLTTSDTSALWNAMRLGAITTEAKASYVAGSVNDLKAVYAAGTLDPKPAFYANAPALSPEEIALASLAQPLAATPEEQAILAAQAKLVTLAKAPRKQDFPAISEGTLVELHRAMREGTLNEEGAFALREVLGLASEPGITSVEEATAMLKANPTLLWRAAGLEPRPDEWYVEAGLKADATSGLTKEQVEDVFWAEETLVKLAKRNETRGHGISPGFSENRLIALHEKMGRGEALNEEDLKALRGALGVAVDPEFAFTTDQSLAILRADPALLWRAAGLKPRPSEWYEEKGIRAAIAKPTKAPPITDETAAAALAQLATREPRPIGAERRVADLYMLRTKAVAGKEITDDDLRTLSGVLSFSVDDADSARALLRADPRLLMKAAAVAEPSEEQLVALGWKERPGDPPGLSDRVLGSEFIEPGEEEVNDRFNAPSPNPDDVQEVEEVYAPNERHFYGLGTTDRGAAANKARLSVSAATRMREKIAALPAERRAEVESTVKKSLLTDYNVEIMLKNALFDRPSAEAQTLFDEILPHLRPELRDYILSTDLTDQRYKRLAKAASAAMMASGDELGAWRALETSAVGRDVLDKFIEGYIGANLEERKSALGMDDPPDDTLGKLLYLKSAQYVDQWAKTSGDGTEAAIAMQATVNKVLAGGKLELHYPEGLAGALTSRKEVADAQMRELFVRAVYDNTQRELRAAGVEEVLVFRGFEPETPEARRAYDSLPEDTFGRAKLIANPLTSWSVSPETAKGFGRVVFAIRVPASRIFSSWLTGFGCTNESEVVVIGVDDLETWARKWR